MATASGPSSPSTNPTQPAATVPADWPVQAADAIERAVGGVRDKTTGPAITVTRAVVYGLFAAILGVAVLVMIAVITIRILDVYLPESITGDDNVWLAHLIVGVVFCVAGMIAWSKRSLPTTTP